MSRSRSLRPGWDSDSRKALSRLITVILAVAVLFSLVILASKVSRYHLPGNHQDYEPDQPIAFSHRLHAGELEIACLYCHSEAARSRYAGIPATATCMNCHKFVTAPLGAVRAEEKRAQKEGRPAEPVVSRELNKLYQSLGLNAKLEKVSTPRPIAWARVHNLPDFVYFDHRAHVGAGLQCQRCHGQVESMERVRQVEDLSMGWCVNCHRDNAGKRTIGRRLEPSIDCATCHY